MRVAWLGVIAAVAAACVPVVAWACEDPGYSETFRLRIKSVDVGGQASADLSSYEGYDVWLSAMGSRLSWTAEKEGEGGFYASYER